MTITSAGYPKIAGVGGRIDAAQFAQQWELMGADYGVVGDAWKVVPVTTGGIARTVQISPGIGYGRGIVDISDAPVNVQCQALGTGVTTRWDTIVARRVSATGVTTFVALPGTATRTIAAGRLVGPGDQDDQVIALVKLESNTGFPTQVADLRKWNGKTSYVNDLAAVVDPGLGEEVVDSTGVRWRYLLVNGTLTRTRVDSSARFQRAGTDITGISLAPAQVPFGTLTQYGVWHGITTVSGRSELSDVINFDVQFSTLLYLAPPAQIHRPPVLSAPRCVEYQSSVAGFQVAWIETVAAGNASPAERAFRWAATGVI